MRSRKRAVGLLVLCATASAFGSLLVYQLIAQEIPYPTQISPSLAEVRREEEQSAEIPNPLPPQAQLEKDPVFQELKKAFLQASNEPKSQPSQSEPKQHSNDRWHAVENLLKAARLLESDARQQLERNEVEECNRTLRTIHSIRAQAVELLK
jgi:hypothetical protein